MRKTRSMRSPAFALAAGLLAAGALPAAAGAGHEHVYADSFGNLVVYSPAGYKRIVVGRGHLAEEYAAAERPDVLYLRKTDRVVYRRDCTRYGALIKGRSYMYGLPEGALPVLEGSCR